MENGHLRGLKFDPASCHRAINFFRDILTVEREEQDSRGDVTSQVLPFVLEPSQEFIVGSLFGWKQDNGLRRFRTAFVEEGKGSGKSPLAAGIGHYMLTATRKLRAEVYAAATDRDQASILFDDAIAMWARSPQLQRILHPTGKTKISQLSYMSRASKFLPISSGKRGKSGIRPYCALIDEIHEHPDESVVQMLRAGTKGNQDALIFEITNSGFDRQSPCWIYHQYSIRVVNGDLQDDQWFAFVCALDEDEDPFEDEACWIKANPLLGVTIQPAYIREQVAEARGMPSKEALVRRLHFCEWVESEQAAFTRSALEKVLSEVNVDALAEQGYPCFGGLDLSRVNDLTAFTLTWVLDPTPDLWHFASRTWFWTPRDTLVARAKRDRAPYDRWANEGALEAVPGKRIGYGWVAEALASLCARYQPVSIGCDQYGLENLREQLSDRGLALPCVVHPQGFQRRKIGEDEAGFDGAEDVSLWMPDSINKLEAAIAEERIRIDDNPVMRLCLTGVIYAQNRIGARMFDKDKATARIDGAVSQAMSIGIATVAPGEAEGSLDDYLRSLARAAH